MAWQLWTDTLTIRRVLLVEADTREEGENVCLNGDWRVQHEIQQDASCYEPADEEDLNDLLSCTYLEADCVDVDQLRQWINAQEENDT